MTAARSCHWTVRAAATRHGSEKTLSLTVQTGEKDPDLAEDEFRRMAREMGYEEIDVHNVTLTSEQ